MLVHCSGATPLEALASSGLEPHQLGGFHPLHVFAQVETALEGLQGCYIGIEAQEPLLSTLNSLAKAIGCHPLPIQGNRAIYHAAAGYVAGFVNALTGEAIELLKQVGWQEQDALQALLPLLKSTVNSLEEKGVAGSVSGPTSRGDTQTLQHHLDQIQKISPTQEQLYRYLALASLGPVQASGRLSPEQLLAMQKLLKKATQSQSAT